MKKPKKQDYGYDNGSSSSGYPDMNAESPYPSLEPMVGYGGMDSGVPGGQSVPTVGGTGYPSFGAPDIDPSMAMPANPQPTYVSPSSTAYPTLSGISGTKFHEGVPDHQMPDRQKTTSTAYPSFDKGGNIVSDEYEPTASTQMPYRSSTIAKPDRELSLEES